jgi:hypothetical protein
VAAISQEYGAIQFFCNQALGIMIEDGVQELYRRISGKSNDSVDTPLWAKIMGYLWVVAFLSWSTPIWVYPWVRVVETRIGPLDVGGLWSVLPTLPFRVC